MGGIGWQQLLIVLVIVALIFGTRKLRNIGSDLGGAVKGFRKAMSEGEKAEQMKIQEDKPDAEFSESAQETPEETKNG